MRERLEAETAWVEQGRAVAEVADGRALLLVAGDDVLATAEVALGIGREQARRRRVAVADLIGEAPPLQRLVSDADPHGVVDSFQHGVSLTKIARQVDEAGNLFVLPTGSEPADHALLLGHERWRRLAAGFREAEALLVVVAPAGAPALDELARMAEGVVAVGRHPSLRTIPNLAVTLARDESGIAAAPAARAAGASGAAGEAGEAGGAPAGLPPVAASVGTPAGEPVLPPRAPESAPADSAPASGVPASGVPASGVPASGVPASGVPAGDDGRLPGEEAGRAARRTILIVVLLALAAAAVVWLLRRREPEPTARTVPAALPADSAGAGEGGVVVDSGIVVDFRTDLTIVNPADSARATPFAVELVNVNLDSTARRYVARAPIDLPAATVTPVLLPADNSRWFRVVAGAYPAASQADSLLRAARTAALIEREAGTVLRAPFALRLARGLSPARAQTRVETARSLGIDAYALEQDDGTAIVYAGAFETPEQAGLLASTLRAAGLDVELAYRTGRLF